MEKILIRYKGNVKVHPSVFLALLTVRVEILKPFHELCRRCGLVILLHPLFYGIQHFSGELKRPTTPLHIRHEL